MIIVSSAPLATATRAIRLNSQAGMPTPVAWTTSSSGPLDADSSSAGRAAELASADQDVDDAGGEQRAEQRPRVDPARVADLLGDVGRGLEADERVVGDDGGAEDRGAGRDAGRELGDPAEVAAAAAEQHRHDDDHDDQPDDLDDGHHQVGPTGSPDAPRLSRATRARNTIAAGTGGHVEEGAEVVAGEGQRQAGRAGHPGRQHAEPDQEGDDGERKARSAKIAAPPASGTWSPARRRSRRSAGPAEGQRQRHPERTADLLGSTPISA